MVEYVGKYKSKENSKNDIDIEVEDIDRTELMKSDARIEKIVDYVIANHDRKTHSRDFNGLFCVSSIEVLTKYYEIFRRRKEVGEHNLKIATIFSYSANEEDKDADGMIGEVDIDITKKY